MEKIQFETFNNNNNNNTENMFYIFIPNYKKKIKKKWLCKKWQLWTLQQW